MRHPLFSPQRHLQQRTETVRQPGKGEWVIGRGLCHYRVFNLAELSPNRREEGLALQIRQWCPFTECASYAVWKGAYAQVWVWDRKRQEVAAEGLKPAAVMPESVLRGAPLAEGVRLIQCGEGVEAQIWRAGCLRASHWWPQAPEPREWNYFRRAHQLPPELPMPALETPQLAARPWGKPRRGGQEATDLLLGAALFAAIYAWQGVALWKTQQALAGVEQRIEALNQTAGSILAARNEASQARQQVADLLALNPYPGQLELFALVGENLPKNGAHLIEWFYQTGELRFTVEAPEINPRWYVETFQNLPLLREVKAESGAKPNQITLGARLNMAQSRIDTD